MSEKVTNEIPAGPQDVHGWLPISSAPEREPVRTKIDDEHGVRNEAVLTRHGRLWYTDPRPKVGMYVYYSPTHWRRP